MSWIRNTGTFNPSFLLYTCSLCQLQRVKLLLWYWGTGHGGTRGSMQSSLFIICDGYRLHRGTPQCTGGGLCSMGTEPRSDQEWTHQNNFVSKCAYKTGHMLFHDLPKKNVCTVPYSERFPMKKARPVFETDNPDWKVNRTGHFPRLS
jgi:hypothetical protein